MAARNNRWNQAAEVTTEAQVAEDILDSTENLTSITETEVQEQEQTIAEALHEIATANDPIGEVQNVKVDPTPTKVYTADQLPYVNKSAEEIFGMFGGEQSRGAISTAIRTLISVGFSKGETAKMLGKRYQHVRNVLIETAKSDETKAIRQARSNAPITLATVDSLKADEAEPKSE
jgi:hypothetical protein